MRNGLILEEQLRNLCNGSIASEVTAREVLSSDTRALQERGSAFGPRCDIADPACLADYTVYAQAIREEDETLCAGVKDEVSQGLCEYEVLFSEILAAGVDTRCVEAQSLEGCQLDFINSLALENEDKAICATHQTPEMQDICENIYDSTNEKRFDYSLAF